MKNAILPSVSSQLYSFGNNIEAISDHVPGQFDSKLNVYTTNSFCFDSNVYDNHGLLGGGGFPISSHSFISYQPGPSSLTTVKRLDYPCLGGDYLTTTSSYNSIPQQPLPLGKKLLVPQCEAEMQSIQSARKRSFEVNDVIPKMGFNNIVGNKPDLKEWMTNNKKKKKTVCLQEKRHVNEELKEIQTQRVPVRRSQKLSDRITALQKLVSPYGKTDTASVLQEASISIKVLQDQIQKLLQTRSTSYNSTKPPHSQRTAKEQLDLRSRGLCLVPVSFTQNLNRESKLDQHTAPRNTT